MIWKKKGTSRIRSGQIDNLRGLLVIRRMEKASNGRMRELCGERKGMDARIDEDGLIL